MITARGVEVEAGRRVRVRLHHRCLFRVVQLRTGDGALDGLRQVRDEDQVPTPNGALSPERSVSGRVNRAGTHHPVTGGVRISDTNFRREGLRHAPRADRRRRAKGLLRGR